MDPYRVWLSEIMLQQTTVRAVGPYFERFVERFPTVRALARAPLDDVLTIWAGLGYYGRARNLHACAKAIIAGHDGRFPCSEAELVALPGIGPYTAAAIACIAFEERTVPVDGNVERVIARLFRVEDALPQAKPKIRGLAQRLAPPARSGDFAQALMDLGATICRPRQPRCVLCPWREPCPATARPSSPAMATRRRRSAPRFHAFPAAAFDIRRKGRGGSASAARLPLRGARRDGKLCASHAYDQGARTCRRHTILAGTTRRQAASTSSRLSLSRNRSMGRRRPRSS
jgi:A/G-specific adenine glycosylase